MLYGLMGVSKSYMFMMCLNEINLMFYVQSVILSTYLFFVDTKVEWSHWGVGERKGGYAC